MQVNHFRGRFHLFVYVYLLKLTSTATYKKIPLFVVLAANPGFNTFTFIKPLF
jgi:hypothetical protein